LKADLAKPIRHVGCGPKAEVLVFLIPIAARALQWERRASNSLTDLIFSHNTFEILGFAFDAVPNTSVRLDRKVSNNSVDGSFAIIGAPLWSLSLMMNIVIY
jgi:hypothetical protein